MWSSPHRLAERPTQRYGGTQIESILLTLETLLTLAVSRVYSKCLFYTILYKLIWQSYFPKSCQLLIHLPKRQFRLYLSFIDVWMTLSLKTYPFASHVNKGQHDMLDLLILADQLSLNTRTELVNVTICLYLHRFYLGIALPGKYLYKRRYCYVMQCLTVLEKMQKTNWHINRQWCGLVWSGPVTTFQSISWVYVKQRRDMPLPKHLMHPLSDDASLATLGCLFRQGKVTLFI